MRPKTYFRRTRYRPIGRCPGSARLKSPPNNQNKTTGQSSQNNEPRLTILLTVSVFGEDRIMRAGAKGNPSNWKVTYPQPG